MKRSLLGIVTVTAILSLGASLSNAATVFVSPSANPVHINDVFDVYITASGFDSLTNGGDFTLAYDHAILQASAAPVDVSIWEFGNAAGTITPGLISFSIASFNDRGPDAAVATVTFTAMAMGVTPLDLEGDVWAGLGGSPIALNYADSSITVNAVPIPAAVWFMMTALGGVGVLARRLPVKTVT